MLVYDEMFLSDDIMYPELDYSSPGQSIKSPMTMKVNINNQGVGLTAFKPYQDTGDNLSPNHKRLYTVEEVNSSVSHGEEEFKFMRISSPLQLFKETSSRVGRGSLVFSENKVNVENLRAGATSRISFHSESVYGDAKSSNGL